EVGFGKAPQLMGGALRDALLSGQPDLMLASADCFRHGHVEAIPVVKYLFQTTSDAQLKSLLALGLGTDGYAPAIPLLGPFLKDPSPRRRAMAAEAVGATGARELFDQVVPLLKDPEPTVRSAAAQGLLRSGDSRFFEPLWELRTDKTLESFAVRAFGLFGKASEVDRLEKLMKESPSSASFVPAAVAQLSPMEPHPLLEKLAQDKDSNVRANAQRMLAQIKQAALLPRQILDAAAGKGSVPVLDAGFWPEVVFVPAAQCTPQVASEKQALPIPLREFLMTANPGERNYAPYNIFSRGCPRECPPEILELLTPQNPQWPTLLQLLRTHPYPEIAPKLAALADSPGLAGSFELLRVFSWCDPAALKERILSGIEKGAVPDGSFGLTKLAEFVPAEEYISLLLKLAGSRDAALRTAAAGALAGQPQHALWAMVSDGRIADRSIALGPLTRFKTPGTLPRIEESLRDKSPEIRALAAQALVLAKADEAIPVAISCLKEAQGEVAWDLAAKIIVYLKEEHRALLPPESSSVPVQALWARLGRKEGAARVLSEFPPTPSGKVVAGLALAPHYSPEVEAKFLPLLVGKLVTIADREADLALLAALSHSPEAATRAKVLATMRGVSLLNNDRIHPACLEVLETLLARGDAGPLERVSWLRGTSGMGRARDQAVALLRKAGNDEASAYLLEFLNVPIKDLPDAVPQILEA
ncbi:MAG TPA: HEAT repeat domain-containing protein, partial [Planctomycetota bacterium]|nr:HEAT repeat domain-containing protein [Planctomycetota bacterium]